MIVNGVWTLLVPVDLQLVNTLYYQYLIFYPFAFISLL